MAIVRFDPFREMVALQDRMHRLFSDSYQPRQNDDLMSRGNWLPPVDIHEIEGALVLRAEVPGLHREDIEITVENNTLTLRGERKPAEDLRREQFHRNERSYGTFVRSFSLPSTVDASKVAAEYKHGVLSITLPVREDAKPRTVNIEVAA